MALLRIRGRGQVTIPAQYRKLLHLEEDAPVNLVLIGETLVITPYRTRGEELAKKFEKAMKRESLSFEDLLNDLKRIRKEHTQTKYGL
ncbi:MAG: AbrB/MazE/SpoVT family DNA-binding domain-containing protein [Elusimicrobia bacterium]|nr:AbrB/MazE/SpoVT family DNA-binding domain-containing protein [Elusimicrobiota bacterium]